MNSLYEVRSSTDDPFAQVIEQFIISQFPGAKIQGTEPLLDLLTKAFVSTNQMRYGSAPNPESLVAIRAAIRANIEKGNPIPVLVPWGGRKAKTGFNIDVAELSALKQLHCLQTRVKEHYAPGIQVNIRIEDTGAWWLYQNNASDEVESYSDSFQKLVRILNLEFIHPIRESSLMHYQAYFLLASMIKEPMLEYLQASAIDGYDRSTSKAWQNLLDNGWKGEIPKSQREYYLSRYKAADPNLTDARALEMLAEYFAGSLARYKLNGTAKDEAWGNDYVQVSFVSAVPGAPTNLVSRNLYYRTVPEKMSRSHMPAWRCRGYFLIGEEEITPKLASFHENLKLTDHWTTLSRAGETIDIETSYRLEE